MIVNGIAGTEAKADAESKIDFVVSSKGVVKIEAMALVMVKSRSQQMNWKFFKMKILTKFRF